jgi:hypothetical protein
MLLRGVVNQNVDAAQLAFRLRDGRATKLFVADVAGNQHTFSALRFDQPLCFSRVFMLVEINNGNVRTLFRIKHRHGSPNAAVAAGNQGNSVAQLSRTDVIAGAGFRLGPHLVLAAGLTALMLWWTDLFLFRHGEKESIFARPSDALVLNQNFCKKIRFRG